MIYKGNIEKMKTLLNKNVQYNLPIGNQSINLNDYIGKHIKLIYKNQINCVACKKKIYKSFGQGYCYNCFTTSPENSECILHPEKCKAHFGFSRDIEWSKKFCLSTHIVYLAISSNLKVGITRTTQIPTRWIDQGATSAIIIAKTPNRHIAGIIEKFLMKYYSDKTNWQKMLKGITENIDLVSEKNKTIHYLPKELKQYCNKNNHITNINFPIKEYPIKVSSINFDKTNKIEGTLSAIKGQYLIIDNMNVINIRKHRGYMIELVV